MKRFLIFLSLLSCMIILTGCATLITGTSQRVHFASNPPGAQVLVNGQPIGFTPLATYITRGKNILVTFKKKGYTTQTVILDKSFNGWVLGNLIIGGLIGIIIDIATGAAYWITPDAVGVQLIPENQSTETQQKSNLIKKDIKPTKVEQ